MIGCQAPRVNSSQVFQFSSGDDAGFLAGAYGLKPDAWQQVVLDSWLAEFKNGRLVHGRCGLAVPRQNGKNGVLEMVELFKLVEQGRKILHTAHEVKTARKAFVRLASFFQNERSFPELAALAQTVRSTNGQEAIVLHVEDCPARAGGDCSCKGNPLAPSIEFVARSRGSGRGFTVDDLVMDEAQDLTDEQLEALLPTISSAPSGDPQQILTGTPPGPRSPGTVLPRVREMGVNGKDKRLAWIEWSVADDVPVEVAVKNWRDNAYETNPSLGVRLNVGTVQDELRSMSADGFARERLGRWSTTKNIAAISMDSWRARFVDPVHVPVDGKRVFGVRFSPDGAEVALAVALKPEGDGPVHGEGIRIASSSEGTRWLVDFLMKRKDEISLVVLDGKFGVGFLVDELTRAGFPKKALLTPRLEQVVQAHSMFDQLVSHGGFSTIEQEEMLKQVSSTVRRQIGRDGGFGWAHLDGGSVPLIDALTLAVWGARTTRRRAGRKAVAF